MQLRFNVRSYTQQKKCLKELSVYTECRLKSKTLHNNKNNDQQCNFLVYS